MALNYLDKAAWDAGVYKDKGNDDDTQQDTSSEDSGYSASGILSAAKNFLEHPFQGMGTVIAPNYTPRPLDDSVYSDIPGTPVTSGQFGELEDESVRDERMKDSADYMVANWPRLYGGVVAADEGLANVVGGIQNAVGGGNGILTNVQRAEEGMQDYRDQWNNEYGDSYFLNPNKFATDVGSGIGSTVPIMALSALMPGAAVAGGTRALTSALSRAGLGRLAMSKAGQALIADTVRSPISSLADSLSEYGTVVNDMMQNVMSEDEARRRAIPMFFKNMALDTFTVPLELGFMKGGKGIATGLLGRSAEEGVAKSIAKGAARTGMLAGASGLTEGYQEGAQNALENDVQGKRDGGWYNPLTWTNEDWEAARGGFVGGALMGVPGNVAAGFHPEAEQAPLSAESQEQAQSIKDTLSHGNPAGMSNAAYNAYIELANSGNPDLIKQAASSLESFQQSQEGSQESTGDAATEAYKDYETYDQKQKIENFLDNNTVEQIGGEKNFNWLWGVLHNGTPEEVQHAYDTVIAAEKATAEQEAKNRPVSGGGSMSPNTGNAMANIVIQAANDSGVEPRLGLAIAARESGGDDVNAISMPEPHDGVYGVMQAQEETVSNMGLDSQYPDWKTDPYQNAMVGMAILKAKIDGENGDVWAGVRDYDGAGEEAEQYRQLVKNNYDNMGDIGGGGSGNVKAPSEAFYDLSEAMNPQVDGMDPNTMAKMNLLAHDFYQKYGHRLLVTSLKRNGDGSSYHDEGHAFDFSDDFLEQNPDTRDWLVQQGEKYGLKGLDEFSHPVATTDGGNVHFTDHGGPAPGGASSGVSGKVTSDNGQFERELDQAAQEAKSDMDKIQAQSDQAINEIMNDDSTEKTAQDAQQDAENAQKQAEEGQQSVQDDVVPDVAQTIRDTSNNIDEINTLDGMFTKDSNGNDKFIDTPENRDFIKTNYKDEIAKAVNDAMSKKKAPSATPVPKSQQQASHARLGRILSTYDRKDPKFKEYMNTFRNGTEQEQQKLADDLQTTQELERANSLKGNPLTTQQDQNIPQNVPQQAVEAPKQTEQVNTPVQEKESLETQKKRKIYLAKKQKLMERVPAGRTVKVHASTNDAGFDATYKIVPAGDITASHDMNYAVNDLYPAEYQPRDRNRPQMRGQVEKMTKGMKPELLAESQFVNEGAPVINNSGVVLNGNGRVMAVQKAYKGLTDAHKKSAKAYKDYLVSIAPSLGIAPEKVQSMDHPVLVRQAADNADTNAIINSTEPAGSGRVHQQEAGRVQSQEKEGNEVDEKSKQSDHVDAEPQQTESKDKESTHAEEGSQGDVQEEVSKFHNVLDDEKSTPKQVIDAYKSVVDKVIASADGSRKNAKMGDKIVTDEYQSLTNSKHWNAFMNEDGGRNWHEVATINADAHRALHAIINTAGVKAKEAPSSQGILPYKQAVDDIMDRLDHKKLTPARAINKLKIIMKDANAARWGEFKAMEAIESKEKLSFDDYKMALDLANDAMKKANDMRLEASRNRKARKTAKELESATKETQNDADIRFGTVDDAEKAVMEAFGVKPHKKPADTPAVPRKASTKDTSKKAAQKAVIKDDTKIEKTFHLLDDSDEALEAEKKAILEELSHLSVNPAFNPVLMYHLLKVGAIHVQRGLNEFAHWAKAMKDTLPQSEPFLRSVWDSLQSMPNNANLDEKQLTAAIRYVGSLYDHGMTDKVYLRKSFIATLGVKNAKYFDAVYNAVMEYPSIEELKGANENVNRNVSELAARSGEGASENAVGESSIQGGTAMRGSRQDTASAGKGPEEPGMGHDSVPGSSAATGRTAGNRRVQTQESKDSAGSTGSTELPGSVRAGFERVPDDDQRRPAELVRAVENRSQHEDPVEKAQEEQKDKHLNEIKKALPMLLPQQAEDVCIAEDRFKKHSGMMFTNGTGTGKTYTGLGVVKRFVDANKKNILIIAPSDGILKQWEEAAAKDFGITLTRLNSTKDAGKGAVTATYANVGANQVLVNRDFDLVITDESHNLMGSESATPTDALKLVRAVTGHKDGFQRYHHDKHPEISSKLDKLHEEIKKLHKQDNQNSKAYNETHDPSLADESRGIRNQIEKLEEEQSKWHKKLEAFKDADEKAFAEKQPSKVLFLSATPFQYVADLDYANGYLFNYSDYGPMDEQGYNRANGREIFYMENFGYKMRYNRLERPSADVDTDLMEREFNRKMVESGAMHGRMLSSAYDYDRGFIRVDAGIGKKIDEGFDWLRDQPKYSELSDFLRGRFTGQQKYYLLEAIKAKQAIPLIKEYLKEGKKVVIFHNFNKGGADNPFAISKEGMDHLERLDSELADHILEQYHEFQVERPDLADLDLNDLESPIETLSKAFGDELALYNGTLSKGEREKNKNAFNNDDSKTKIILVQSAAGQAGVSLHDTTGKYQRSLINLGLPTKPSEAIQQEGRIYRVGNKSNAIFRYLNTGTYMEQTAFATKLAERAGTVENIALGEMARSLKQAYVEAFEESQEGDGWKKYLPGSKTEGTGGKANDYRQEQATDFDRAKAVYFGKQKKNSRTKSQEGQDYFATPEPIGYKMVQWLQSKPGQSLLEPSAGDGAIARWMPDNTYNTAVEPSRDLTPKLMRNVAGAKVVESTFENFDLHNKFDGIAMNPPFGHGGKTAVEHVAKAYQHLKDGGRLIAIIPDGPACQKHFDKWFYGDPEAKRKADRGIADGVLMADIHLPSVTFDRAGTKVNTRMVVIDKHTDEGTRQIAEAEARGRIDIAADDVNELFDRIEGMDMPERLDMSDEKKQASIRKAGQQLTRSKEDLKAEIKEAFPNAKEIKDEGDRMTFTMPNGSHIVVDVKNEILLTDKELAQAKKDHHIDDNGNVVVEGYAQFHGKDAYMALSQGSRENTGFHEAYHLAEGAVLTDREKAAIKKAIPDAEKRADKYAEWVEARKHGRGTAWGKLFQKIKDFAAKMKKIFTGVETVNDIFRQIESGKVWEREANEQNTNNINGEKYYSIRKQDEKISRDAKKKLMKHVEIAQKKADGKDIGVHRTFLQSPSRIAEKKKYFRPFFKMADDAMNLLTKLRADYQRHLDSALNLSKKDKASLQELLWAGDMEGKEYTREELREQGYDEKVIDSYWQIRNLFRKAYNQLNETRKQAKTKTGHFSGRKLDELRHNKFVEILRETEQDDGSTLVSYKEYGNWQSHYLVNEDELKALENDDNIQILEKIPTTEGPMDGQKHWKITTREGVPDIHDRKGYVPHFFHEYMVRFVDSHGKATVISSGRTIREATKKAIEWQTQNKEMLQKRNENDWKITITPKVFDFGEVGLDESKYATTVGDEDFYRMTKKIADRRSLTLHEAKDLLDGVVKKKGRHRFFGNFLRRTGANGYEQEIEWVLRHYFNSTSRYVAMESKFKPQAISLFERLFGRFDNEYHGLPNYIKEYINDINGNPSTLEKQLNDLLNTVPVIGKWVNARFGDRATVALANSITNKISIAKLGFLNVSSAMLNILQVANAAAYTGSVSTIWKALLKGAHRKYSLHDLKILRETNVLNDIGLDSGAGYGKFSAGKWANRGMILFKESEGIVRRGVTLAAYETGRKRGMSHTEAIQYAKDVNRKSNFDYGVHDAPGIFRRGSIFSQIFLQFKKYPIKQLEAMKDFLPFFGKGTTKKQKAIFWGTYFAMAGLFQIPFANILGLLVMGITGDDPEKEAKNNLIELAENYPSLKPLAKIGMYGIGAFANVDITSRVGIGDAVPDDLQSIFGPAASTLFNVAKSAYGGDSWTKQVRNISPGLGNLLLATQGESTGKRGRVSQEYSTPYQRLLRGMGFQSTDESDSYLIQSILSTEKKKASSKKQQLIDEYINNPTGENARKLKAAGIKPATVKAEQKKKKLDTKERTESGMNKNDKKQYKYLLDW